MIRSRLANVLIALFGTILVSFTVAAGADLVHQRGPRGLTDPFYVLFIGLPFGSTGLWCLVGGLSNLYRLKRLTPAALPAKGSRRYVFILFLMVTGLCAMIGGVVLAGYSVLRTPEIVACLGGWAILLGIVLIIILELLRYQKEASGGEHNKDGAA